MFELVLSKIEQRGVEDVEKEHHTILNYDPLIGDSEAIQRLKSIIRKIAVLDTPVMLYGEAGTGKETIARSIHANSRTSNGHFISVHTAGIPPIFHKNALFGHGKAAEGVYANQAGYFAKAEDGVIFINEIDELDAATQVKLLHTLQNNEFYRVESTEATRSNARVIGATNKNLKKLVKNGYFRQDLFYRLNIITLEIPPLRERREDIPLLARHFVNEYSKKHHVTGFYMLPETMAILQHYDWPGNVSELKNVIEQLVLSSDSKRVDLDRPLIKFSQADSMANAGDQFLTFVKAKALYEHDSILDALRRSQGTLSPSDRLARSTKQNGHSQINQYGVQITSAPKTNSLSEIDCLN